MSWVRVDDGFPDHAKVVRLEESTDAQTFSNAVTLWLLANCWCNRNETDGRVPKSRLGRLVPFRPGRAAAALVSVSLWHDEGDHFRFHDHGDYNPTKEEKQDDREAARLRMECVRANKPPRSPGVRANIQRSSPEVRSTPSRPDPDPQDQQQKLPSPSAPAPVASPTGSPLSVTRPPSEKKSASRSKKPEHVADPRHAPFKAHFMARWLAAKGAEFYWTPRDARDTVRVLALGDNGEIRRRLEIALADPFFLKTGRVGQLADGWNGYANQHATGPPLRPDGGATAMLAEVDAIKRERAAKLRASEAAGGRRDSADSAEPGGGAEPAGGRVV